LKSYSFKSKWGGRCGHGAGTEERGSRSSDFVDYEKSCDFVGLVGIASVREGRPPHNHSRLNRPGRVKGMCVKSLSAPRTVLILPGVSLATTVVLQVGDSPGLPAHRGLHSCSGRLPQLALAIALRLCFVFLSQRMMCQDTQVAEGVEPVSGTHGLPKHDKFKIFGDA
jgi:hypothetical protein